MDEQKRIFTILSIEGGGIRGIVAARILQEIEERTGQPISSLFDLVGGPSTGAIIGGNLLVPDEKDPTKPRYSAKDVLDSYKANAAKIFPPKPWRQLQRLSSPCLYDAKMLEKVLEETLGDIKVGDILGSLSIPAIDLKRFKPIWITHLQGQKVGDNKEDWSNMLLRDAIRGATSAPTFFPAKALETTDRDGIKKEHPLIDGAFFGGNVLRHLMAQAKHMAPDAEIVVVHAGAGLFEGSIDLEEFNQLGVFGLTSKANGAMLMAFILEISVVDALNDLKDEIGDSLFEFNGDINLSDPESPTPSIDDARPENIERLEKLAEKVIKKQDAEIDRLCKLLLTRQARAERHLTSETAFEQLKEKMSATKSVGELMRLYLKVTYFGEAQKDPKFEREAHLPENQEIRKLVDALIDHHKDALDLLYPKLLRQKQARKPGITPDANAVFTPPAQMPPADNDNVPVVDMKKKNTPEL